MLLVYSFPAKIEARDRQFIEGMMREDSLIYCKLVVHLVQMLAGFIYNALIYPQQCLSVFALFR